MHSAWQMDGRRSADMIDEQENLGELINGFLECAWEDDQFVPVSIWGADGLVAILHASEKYGPHDGVLCLTMLDDGAQHRWHCWYEFAEGRYVGSHSELLVAVDA